MTKGPRSPSTTSTFSPRSLKFLHVSPLPRMCKPLCGCTTPMGAHSTRAQACRAHPVQTPASHQLKTSSGHHARRRLGLPGCVIALPINSYLTCSSSGNEGDQHKASSHISAPPWTLATRHHHAHSASLPS